MKNSVNRMKNNASGMNISIQKGQLHSYMILPSIGLKSIRLQIKVIRFRVKPATAI
jgi:hypothetical protein